MKALNVGMAWLFNLLLACVLGLTVASQEVIIEVLNVYDPEVLQATLHSGYPLAVSLSDEDIGKVSSSVLKAESWLRTHVLAHFPASKITNIVVGDDTLSCANGQDHNLGLVLPTLKNLHHSLTRWGLARDIKVSAAFSSHCLDSDSALLRDEVAEKVTKPLIEFLHSTNSTYSINLPPNFSPLSHVTETATLVSSHREFVKKLAPLTLNKLNLMVTSQKHIKLLNRRLSTVDSKIVDPYAARPSPLPEIPRSPLHSSFGFSVPPNIAKNPRPPLARAPSQAPLSFPLNPPSPMAFPIAPEQPPLTSPATAPNGYSLPPCNPVHTMAPTPLTAGAVQKQWCVAKPSVPEDTLQQALDYACGEGGADCEDIKAHGNCFYPNTVVAHASFALNSYWQTTKRNGGTCSFGGTAMIINSDPSFLQCRFILN